MQGKFGYSYGFNPNQHPTGLIIPDWVIIVPNKRVDYDVDDIFCFVH